MAKTIDYVDKHFGSFLINKVISGGAESEVFSCIHKGNGLHYILRLPALDQELWKGDAIIPPKNAQIEANNIESTWYHSSIYFKSWVESNDRDGWKMATVPIYGVHESRYLVPVASAIRVKNCLDIDQILKKVPREDIDGYGPMEEIILLMATTASIAVENNSIDEWKNSWSSLTGGDLLAKTAEKYLRSGQQSEKSKKDAIQLVFEQGSTKDELPDNLLMRLAGALVRGRISLDEAKGTIRDKHFRVNLSYDEINQVISAYQILESQFFPSKDTINLLGLILVELSEPPKDLYEHSSEFEEREKRTDLDDYQLFLQEYAGADQPIPMVTKTKK